MPYDDNISDSALLTIHPELAPILDKHGIPPMRVPTRSNIAQFRKGFAVANKRLNSSPLARNALGCSDPEDSSSLYWEESDHSIPTHDDNSTITVRIYRPRSLPQSGVPVVVLMHGGGWIMGDANTEALLARLFCVKLGVLVVNVAFRNYPDVEFGVPLRDCFDAVKWTARDDTVKRLGGNCEIGFVLAGVSGGATYATVCAHLARDEGLVPKVTGQWMTCPVLSGLVANEKGGEVREIFDLEKTNRSQLQNANAMLMNDAMKDAILTFVDYDASSKSHSPFMCQSHSNLGVGGVYVQVAGLDPWRDGGRIYAGLCTKDGVRTKLKVYEGLPHCWWTHFPMLKVTQKWLEDCVSGLLWLLEEQPNNDEREKPKL